MGKEIFYAVLAGNKRPGINNSWEACSEQVTGFTGNSYKGYMTLEQPLKDFKI